MSKAKVLFIAPSSSKSGRGVSQELTDLGYEVSSASTPEETVLAAMEEDPQVIIWPDALNNEGAWSRVKNVLESRNPLISIANDFNSAAISEDTLKLELRETPGGVKVPLATMNALVEQLEHIGNHGSGNHQFYTKVGNKLRRIELDEIRYIQVEGKYSAIQLASRQYHVKASLKDLLVILASDEFVRVSRNFVVNLKHIDHIDVYQSTVHVAGEDVPVSRTYKENLMKNVRLI
ncbi:MAG: hypothetical protein CBD69_001670 [Crocinitomicaceae bacterium TMED209]|nr:MAG: hypothetical protein CBD69_001670 [Crocinitomicaceae bacterium TMED209]